MKRTFKKSSGTRKHESSLQKERNLQFPRSPQPLSIIPLCPVSFNASNIISVVFLGSSRGLTNNRWNLQLYSTQNSWWIPTCFISHKCESVKNFTERKTHIKVVKHKKSHQPRHILKLFQTLCLIALLFYESEWQETDRRKYMDLHCKITIPCFQSQYR